MSPKKSNAVSMDENSSEVCAALTKKKPREKKPKLPRKPRLPKTKRLKPIKIKLKSPKRTVSNYFACPLAAALEEKEFPDAAKHLPPAAILKLANEVALAQLTKKPASQPTSPLTNEVVTETPETPFPFTSRKSPRKSLESNELPTPLTSCSPCLVVSRHSPIKMTPLRVAPLKMRPVKKKRIPKRKISNTDMIDDVDGPILSNINAVPNPSIVVAKQTAPKVKKPRTWNRKQKNAPEKIVETIKIEDEVTTRQPKKQAVRRIRRPKIIPDSVTETDLSEVSEAPQVLCKWTANSDEDYKPPLKKLKETLEEKPLRKRVRNPPKTRSKQPAKLAVTPEKDPDRTQAPMSSVTTDGDDVYLDADLKPTAKRGRGRPKKIIMPDTNETLTNTSCPVVNNAEMPQTQDISSKKKKSIKNKVTNLTESKNQTFVQEVMIASKDSNKLQETKENCLPGNMVPAKKTINSKEQNNQQSRTESRITSVSDTFSWALEISSSSTTTTQSREWCPKDVKIILDKIDSPKLASNQHKGVVNGDLVASNKRKGKPVKRQIQPKIMLEDLIASERSAPLLNNSSSSSTSDSSSSSISSTTKSSKASAIKKLTQIREDLRQMKHSLDEEFYIWIGDDNTTEQDIDRLVQVNSINDHVLRPELEFIRDCQMRRKYKKLSNNDANYCDNVQDTYDNIESSPRVEPEPREVTDIPVSSHKDVVGDESFSDIIRRKTNEDCHFDDDAISLFATESLNGYLESRKSVASPREFDEDFDDVLEPVTTEFQFIKPNKVPNTPVGRQKAKKSDKEIVLPDSTSIPNNTSLDQQTEPKTVLTNDKPILMSDRSRPAGSNCRLFGRYCFYNLISNCRRDRCRYPHEIPPYHEIVNTLLVRREEDLISEYLFVRTNPRLRELYAEAFATVCDERGMTNCLLEIVRDTCKETERLKTEVRERALLHLNHRDLNDSADLLQISTQDNELLCDVLMKTMAETTNFSRFKPVFVKLTRFMTQVGRAFSLEVATMLLERVLILPFEDALVRSLIAIMKNTDRSILQHSQISDLVDKIKGNCQTEIQQDLEHYMAVPKAQIVRRVPPKVVYEEAQYPAATGQAHKRYTSPDTTHFEQNRPWPVQQPPQLSRTTHNYIHRVPPPSGKTPNFNNTPKPSSGNLLNFNSAPPPPSVRWQPRADERMFTPNRMMYQRGHGVGKRGQGRIRRMQHAYYPRGHRGGAWARSEGFPRRPLADCWDGYGYPPPPP